MLYILFFCLLIALYLMGPRPDTTVSWNAPELPADLDEYLRVNESMYSDITAGTEKEIIWTDEVGKQSEWAIVYLHGFTATSAELRPVADEIAKNHGANLFYTRFAGHGRGSKAMLDGSLSLWSDDVAEALAIGRRIGKRTLVMATSNGGTLSLLALNEPRMAAQIDAVILTAPNLGFCDVPTWAMNLPWMERITPLFIDKEKGPEPRSAGHAKYWTVFYPTRAAIGVAGGLRKLAAIDFSKLGKPMQVFYSELDQVVVAEKIKNFIDQYGGPIQSSVINDTEDCFHHILAGDVLSPSTNKRVIDEATVWFEQQKML